MSRPSMTVGELFFEPGAPTGAEAQAPSQTQQDIERANPVVSVKQAFEDRAKAVPWSYARGQIEAKMLDALDVGIGDIIGAAWAKVAKLAKYLDSEKYPPEETILVHLADHTIKSTFHPSLEVRLNEVPVGEPIPLDVTVALMIKGLILKIQGGKILEAKTGTCQAMGSLGIAGHKIAEKEFAPIKMPGVIGFETSKRIEI